MKIDLRTKNILNELSENSRISCTALSKKLKISVEATHARLKKLEADKIIQKYNTMISIELVGYSLHKLYGKFIHTSKENENEIIEKLVAKNEIITLNKCSEHYDITFQIKSKNKTELNQILTHLEEELYKSLEIVKITSPTEEEFYSKSFLINKEKRIYKVNHLTNFKVDELDRQILKEISNNPRITSLALSNRLNSNFRTIKRRIINLEKTKIIAGYSTILNLKKLGLQAFKVDIKLGNPNYFEQLKDVIQSNQFITYYQRSLDEYPIELTITCFTKNEFYRTIEELKASVKNELDMKTYEELEIVKIKYC